MKCGQIYSIFERLLENQTEEVRRDVTLKDPEDPEKELSFEEFKELLTENQALFDMLKSGPRTEETEQHSEIDSKVLDFLRLLEEY